MRWWENNVFVAVMALTIICVWYVWQVPATADTIVSGAIGAIAGFVTAQSTKRKDETIEKKPE